MLILYPRRIRTNIGDSTRPPFHPTRTMCTWFYFRQEPIRQTQHWEFCERMPTTTTTSSVIALIPPLINGRTWKQADSGKRRLLPSFRNVIHHWLGGAPTEATAGDAEAAVEFYSYPPSFSSSWNPISCYAAKGISFFIIWSLLIPFIQSPCCAAVAHQMLSCRDDCRRVGVLSLSRSFC